MKISDTARLLKKWLRRIAISYMLGFASAIDQDVKQMDGDFIKIERTTPEEKD